MYTQYHISITREALDEFFSKSALEVIIQANILQDNLSGQIGHPEFHYDDCAFTAGDTYILELRNVIPPAIKSGDRMTAWQSFGKLTHASQDYYSHSNYINLWADQIGNANKSSITAGEVLLPSIMDDPRLVSGRFYAPWELITFLPWIGRKLARLFPDDSHAKLNKDSPNRSRLFPIVYQAAVLRTIFEYNEVIKLLLPNEQSLFRDLMEQ